MASKKKLSAIVLFALVSAAPAQAVEFNFDWFESLFGVGGGDPVASTTGGSGGGGHPGVDPVITINPLGVGGGGGDPPGVDPN